MPILPLPQFETDLQEADREAYERLQPPKTMVVRFGSMRLIGEFPYNGDTTPGCGSKVVARTHRGTELGEMLTSTCPNSGCGKSVSRKEMLEYIENSGGSEYPFFEDGKVLRVATTDDMHAQRRIDEGARERLTVARRLFEEHKIDAKVVEVESIIGAERVTVYYTCEARIDFRELVKELARAFDARIQMHQIGARDEARLVADFEKCGQHCCCKQFLKVLKPVSMTSAKVQKASLDPLKISGRCGRLMCCLRYEDQTYKDLKKNLPHRKTRVGTPEGVGIVVDSQILTQLVRVRLEDENRDVAIPVEELCTPEEAVELMKQKRASDPMRGQSPEKVARRLKDPKRRPKDDQQRGFRETSQAEKDAAGSTDAPTKKKKRRRKRKKPTGADQPSSESPNPKTEQPPSKQATPDAKQEGAAQTNKKKRRRRRGRKPGPGGAEGSSGAPSGGPPPSSN